ncbi:hypothetical protein [Paenibacillus silvisoli]|uniref:hypothetical protein n=1 Tax=Paenibacillus silvisoli TaxID=3110539 RepID=UPI0028053799|nr:hypothetical protein [Paenibacillus silvisoli]
MKRNLKRAAASCFLFVLAVALLVVTGLYVTDHATAQRVKQLQALEQAQHDYYASLQYTIHDEANHKEKSEQDM